MRKMDVCGKGYKATICDPKLRTYNTNATCGGPDDYYYYSPWRAPGSAPVFDVRSNFLLATCAGCVGAHGL